MLIPEWEVEEAVASNPAILEMPPEMATLVLVERQRYLKSIGRYIDLLFKAHVSYVIVELKNKLIDDTSTVLQQVLPYRTAFASEEGISENNVLCVLASPEGFSADVESICRQHNVLTRKVDYGDIRRAEVKPLEKSLLSVLDPGEEDIVLRVLARRRANVSEVLRSGIEVMDDVASAKTWNRLHLHDDNGLHQIADRFRAISKDAPLMAHEVRTSSSGRLVTNNQMWFWLFYSVLDRRTNAATIVKAKNALEKNDLFLPEKIVELTLRDGKQSALEKIRDILVNAGFPLIKDSANGDQAGPRSIVEAAFLIRQYDYDFVGWYNIVLRTQKDNLDHAFHFIWSDLQERVYGVGPRIASQFVRGMVLKGPWHLPLTDDCLLEESGYNVTFAGPHRFNLVGEDSNFRQSLSEFADGYLEGNRAIVSHVLWYIRKSVCDKTPLCFECPMAGFCTYYLKSGYSLTSSNQTVPKKGTDNEQKQVPITQFVS